MIVIPIALMNLIGIQSQVLSSVVFAKLSQDTNNMYEPVTNMRMNG